MLVARASLSDAEHRVSRLNVWCCTFVRVVNRDARFVEHRVGSRQLRVSRKQMPRASNQLYTALERCASKGNQSHTNTSAAAAALIATLSVSPAGMAFSLRGGFPPKPLKTKDAAACVTKELA